jgi:hypothetical protein
MHGCLALNHYHIHDLSNASLAYAKKLAIHGWIRLFMVSVFNGLQFVLRSSTIEKEQEMALS